MGKLIAFLKKYPFVEGRKPNKKIHKPLVSDKMCCPFCGQPLVEHGKKRLQTLSEHVFDPNGTPSEKAAYYCDNPDCKLGKVFMWNGGYDSGEAFINDACFTRDADGKVQWTDWASEAYDEAHKWYHSATNSISIACEMGESWQIMLHPALLLGFYRPYIEVTPKANQDATISGNHYKLCFLRKESPTDSDYHILHIPGIHMLAFDIKQRKKKRSLGYLKDAMKTSTYTDDEKELGKFKEAVASVFSDTSFVPRWRWTKYDWWRGAAEKWMRFFYYGTYSTALLYIEWSYERIYGKDEGERMYKQFLKQFNEG